MNNRTALASALALCAVLTASFAFAAEMKDMPGMKTTAPVAAKPATKPVVGQGVIKGVDAKSGTVTISHGPIKELNWPAMTMGFKVADPALLKTAKVGKTVEFVLEDRGEPTIVSIK
ncbi:MAG: copper-binding protein [Pseudomonadota bacterium]